MACPNCNCENLASILTQQGIEVDYCPTCRGIWLDKGEIYYFTKTPTYLKQNLEEALKNPLPSNRLSPKTNSPLIKIVLFGINLDYCTQTEGIWLDEGELEKLPGVDAKNLDISLDKRATSASAAAKMGAETATKFTVAGISPLPNLTLASVFTLTGLYALLTLLLILCVQFLHMPPATALTTGIVIVAIQFIFGPFIMDLSLRWFYKVSWQAPEELPQNLRDFIIRIAAEKKIKFPRIGLIPDGAPQAFTYGHHPNNARIVFSKGLLLLLNPEETEAVAAHEIGHAVHWDMLVMTLANLVPLVLYYIYRTLIRMRSGSNDKSAPIRLMIAVTSYVLYVISEYVVLWFSRTREYFADRFSGEITGNPNALAQALVKIGYGLAGQKSAGKEEAKRRPQMEAIGSMGVFDTRTAQSLAVAGYSTANMGGEVNKELLKDAMKWDLWNPWALYYELHSTHPLIAKRLDRLSEQSAYLGKTPYIVFDRSRPECFWDDFLIDLFFMALPIAAIIAAVALYYPIIATSAVKFWAGLAMIFGAGYLINIVYSYASGKEYPEFTVAGLLKNVKVSAIRPIPCTLRGKIIGRGVPGLIWSEDFVLQDETGIIFLDFRQPLGIWEFLFGLLRAKKYVNEDVIVSGWYRRSPVPYIELKTLRDSQGKTLRSYVYYVKLVVSFLLIIGGIIFFYA